MRSTLVLCCLASIALLAACGEKPQVAESKDRSVPAYMGTGGGPYTAEGWKPGDEGSWEEKMRLRTQSGQNEYPRASGN